MTNELDRLRALMPQRSQRQIKEDRRRGNIAAWADDIARLKVMQDIAADNPDFADHERKKFAKEIIDIRRAIIAELSTAELFELQSKKLQPEQARQVIRDKPEAAESEDVRQLRKALWREQLESAASQQFFVAEKGFSMTLQPGVSVDELIRNYPEQRNLLKRFVLASKTSTEPIATTADAALNHRPDLK